MENKFSAYLAVRGMQLERGPLANVFGHRTGHPLKVAHSPANAVDQRSDGVCQGPPDRGNARRWWEDRSRDRSENPTTSLTQPKNSPN